MKKKPAQPTRKLTHIRKDGQPGMVAIADKTFTKRTAMAEAVVLLPAIIARNFSNGDLKSAKGPVFHTAIIAGTQAVKDTSRLIPFCHPLPIDQCSITISRKGRRVHIRCQVGATYKTGVEIEALTGASIAALTIYDMCKALSHDMEILSVRLLKKTGGKSDPELT